MDPLEVHILNAGLNDLDILIVADSAYMNWLGEGGDGLGVGGDGTDGGLGLPVAKGDLDGMAWHGMMDLDPDYC